MLELMQRLVNRKNEKGASAVEYGLLVAAIAAIIVVVVFAIGRLVNGAFSSTCNAIDTQGSSASTTAGGNCA